MFIDVDYSREKKKAKIELAKPNKIVIRNLSTKKNDNVSLKLGSIYELNFTIPHMIEENHEIIHNPEVDMIIEKMLIKFTLGDQVEWFIIDEIDETGDSVAELNVKCFSLGYQISHKRIGYLEMDAVKCEAIVAEILDNTPWKIAVDGIDLKFRNVRRTFEFTSSNALDALIQTADTFGAVIIWNSVNQTISFKDSQSIGSYRGMSVDYGRLLKSISRSRTTDEMVTRMYMEGNDGLSIHGVNPTGQSYVEDFSFYMHPFSRDTSRNVIRSSNFMTDELCHALLDHANILSQKAPQIKALVDALVILLDNITLGEIQLKQLNLEFENILHRLDTAKSAENNSLISTLSSERDAKQSEINSRNTAVNLVKDEYVTKSLSLERLRGQVLTDSNFTSTLLSELLLYTIEKEWKDDKYIDAQDLYDDGMVKFEEMRQPKVLLSVDIENLFEIIEEQIYWDKLILGDFIKVRYPQMNMEYMARIIQIDYDIESGKIQVKIANSKDTTNEIQQWRDLLSDAKTASTILDNNRYKFEKISQLESNMEQFIHGQWDANKRTITAGVNNQIEIGQRGIIIKNPDFPNEVIVMQSGIVALSMDGGDTWKTAIRPDGIIAERIVGKLILGMKMIIEDENGIMRFTGSLQEIFDTEGNTKVQIGEYEKGVYGLRVDSGSIEIVNGLPKTQIDPDSVNKWDSAEDNAKVYSDSLKRSTDNEISEIISSLDALDTVIEGSFRDGVISEAESIAIEKHKNILNSEKSDIDARYNFIYTDVSLIGVAKTNLFNAKADYNTAHTNLISSINNAISDKLTTIVEKQDVDTKFITYRSSLAILSDVFEKAISFLSQAKADKAKTDANIFTQGKIDAVNLEISDVNTRVGNLQFFIDDAFSDGLVDSAERESLKGYIQQLNNEKSDIDGKYISIYGDINLIGTPKTNLYNAKVPTATGFDKIHTDLISTINSVILDNIITKAEIDTVNALFVTYRSRLNVLSTRFEEAIRNIETNKANKAEDNAKTYADVQIAYVNTVITGLRNSLTTLENEIGDSFRDGIIEESEAISISRYLNTLDSDKASIDSRYDAVYANTDLTGAPKSTLSSTKTAFNNAHTNLRNAIVTAIADRFATTAEIADVNTKFVTYKTTLSNLSSAFDGAIHGISQQKANVAEANAKTYSDGTNTTLRTDLRLTASLPTSISMNASGITAYTSNASYFARLDYRGLYVQGGAVDIRTSATSNRGIVLDANGFSSYNSVGTRTFYVDTNGVLNATSGNFSGNISGATGTFSGSLSGASITGATGTFSGSLSAVNGTFSGDISGASGTFKGSLSGASITGGSISGTTITGGSITSNTTINVTDGIQVGNYINIGEKFSNASKTIYFNSVSNITYSGTDVAYGMISMNASMVKINQIACDNLSFAYPYGSGTPIVDFRGAEVRFTGATIKGLSLTATAILG